MTQTYKVYLQIIAFLTNSGKVREGIFRSTNKSYYKSMVLKREEESPTLQLKAIDGSYE